MSGSAITTFELPSYLGYLASMSPNVRDTYQYIYIYIYTDNLPGRTLCGPTINSELRFLQTKGDSLAYACVLK